MQKIILNVFVIKLPHFISLCRLFSATDWGFMGRQGVKAHSLDLIIWKGKDSGGEVKVLVSRRTQIMNLFQGAETNLSF